LKVAAIDLGTNSVRLLLADVSGGRVDDVVRETTVTRLGAGVDRRRRLDAAAVARTRGCLAGYAAQVASFEPAATLLVATSVLRDAADGPAFLERVKTDLALPWTILTGEQEAALSFAGALSGQSGAPRRSATLVVDIGGGSVELAVGTPPGPAAPYPRSLHRTPRRRPPRRTPRRRSLHRTPRRRSPRRRSSAASMSAWSA